MTGRKGSLAAGPVATVESPNRRQRFLGEFGGPAIGRPGERDWNGTRVDQTVSLSMKDIRRHARAVVEFDLYVLKSSDGNSGPFGPDGFQVSVQDGPVLLATTFSNNPKIKEDGSHQDYPAPVGKSAINPLQTCAASVGTLGYDNYFKESVYHS